MDNTIGIMSDIEQLKQIEVVDCKGIDAKGGNHKALSVLGETDVVLCMLDGSRGALTNGFKQLVSILQNTTNKHRPSNYDRQMQL